MNSILPELLLHPYSAILLIVSSLIMGMSRGGLGGGLGLLGVLIAAQVMSPIEAAAFMLPILIVTDPISMWIYRHSIDWKSLKELLPGVLVGVALGTLLISSISVKVLQAIIGLLSLSLVFNGLQDIYGKKNLYAFSKIWGFGLGTLAGFSSFLIHAGLPPVAAYILPKKLPRTTFMGTTAVFFGITNFIKVFPYVGLGLFNYQLAKLTLIMIPISLVGIWIGRVINHKISDKIFYLVVYFSVCALGIRLLILALI